MHLNKTELNAANSNSGSWVDRIIAYESALAEGATPAPSSSCDLPKEDQERLDYGCKAVNALQQAFQTQPEPEAESAPQTLGDFRILREIGRGGMGVVYEAEQLSIGRRVALKVLPFAAMLDRVQLNRFKNEARAAGTLDHPNIVAVHSVGTERGVHYYAMQLVEGQNVAEVIAARQKVGGGYRQEGQGTANGEDVTIDHHHRPLTRPLPLGARSTDETIPVAALSTVPDSSTRKYYHKVVELGIQAAEALDHAHNSGIVHRDVKPGNLLLDAEGKLYVTDFGLARIETDAGMTMTGDLIGTLRYMSPEQALANRVMIDHRTDIYSLGVTLYELLALKPAYSATDRQELLKQIAFEEPANLRRQDPGIPGDLQTIVAKAMEKNPADRYKSAQALADDLRCFSMDQPIKARPPTTLQRITRWSRRHQTAMLVAMAFLVFATCVAAAAAVAIEGKRVEAEANAQLAEENRQHAVRQRDQALLNLYMADIRVASEEWRNSQFNSLQRILDKHVPGPHQADFRGWEWHYLKSLGTRGVTTLVHDSDKKGGVKWSPDGKLFASAGNDRSLRIYDAVSKTQIQQIQTEDRLRSIAWDAKGGRIASTAWKGPSRIWDVRTGKHILTFPKSSRQAYEVTWHPDGKQIALCAGGVVHVHDTSNGARILKSSSQGFVWSVTYSPKGDLIATGGNAYSWGVTPKGGRGGGLIKVLDAGTLEEVLVIADAHHVGVDRVSWSPDGTKLASVSRDHWLKIWDAETGAVVAATMAHKGTVEDVTWCSDGQRIATCAFNGEMKKWTLDRDQLHSESYLGHSAAVVNVDWSPSGEFIASASRDGAVKIWNADQPQGGRILPVQGGVAWRPNGLGELIVAQPTQEDGELIELNIVEPGIRSNSSSTSIPGAVDATYCSSVRWSPNADHIAYAYASTSNLCEQVKVVDRLSGRILLHAECPNRDIRCIRWSPCGRFLAIGFWRSPPLDRATWRQSLQVWDLSTKSKLCDLTTPDSLESLCWSPSGKYLATAHPNHDVVVWATSPWRNIVTFDRIPKSDVPVAGGENMLAWSCDEEALFAGCGNGWVIKWNVATGREEMSFEAHEEKVTSIALSPDEQRIATSSADGKVKIWDAFTGDLMLTLRGHQAPLKSVEWSPDGRCLLSFDANELRVWDSVPAQDDPR